MRSIHSFVRRSSLGLSRDYLPGYPVEAPGHLLISAVLSSPVRQDIDILVSFYGAGSVRSMLGHMVEKGRISSAARQQAENILERHEDQSNLFRTL